MIWNPRRNYDYTYKKKLLKMLTLTIYYSFCNLQFCITGEKFI